MRYFPTRRDGLHAIRLVPLGAAALAAILLSGTAVAQDAPQPGQTAAARALAVGLQHRSAGQMSAPDAALVHARAKEIADEALFFGYDLDAAAWSYDEVLTPVIPDYMLLHYRRSYRNGTQSVFTALVPRSAGRVLVVPVLYRNATPFESAAGAARTISVFNRVVPAAAARRATESDGDWLDLALGFAAVAGAEPTLPRVPEPEPALVRAPVANAMNDRHGSVRELQFSDRSGAREYTVWNIELNAAGRVLTASETNAPVPASDEPDQEQAAAAAEPEASPEGSATPAPMSASAVPAAPPNPGAPENPPAIPAAQPVPSEQPVESAAAPAPAVTSPEPAEPNPAVQAEVVPTPASAAQEPSPDRAKRVPAAKERKWRVVPHGHAPQEHAVPQPK